MALSSSYQENMSTMLPRPIISEIFPNQLYIGNLEASKLGELLAVCF